MVHFSPSSHGITRNVLTAARSLKKNQIDRVGRTEVYSHKPDRSQIDRCGYNIEPGGVATLWRKKPEDGFGMWVACEKVMP